MTTLRLRFPGGRYHATPWGHHVNEGLVEWPPSPWRVLRALVACGYATLGWGEGAAEGRELFGKLASVLPSYRLPPVSLAHSRHYMPTGELQKGNEKTTLVFDAWANVGDGVLAIHWPVSLSAEERKLLGDLACNLAYLGRAESWVDAELLEEGAALPEGFDATPHQEGSQLAPGFEQISLLAPESPAAFHAWLEERREAALAAHPLPERRRPSEALRKRRERAVEPYPKDWLDALQKGSAFWQEHGWSQPPGSRRVLYWRRKENVSVNVPAIRATRQAAPVQAMLLSLHTSSRRTSSLPPITQTLRMAERIHRSLVAQVTKESGNSPVLTGRDEARRPLRGNRHAHILPLDLDGDKRIDHILVHAAMGLDDRAQRAVRWMRRTWTKHGANELDVSLAGLGKIENLRRMNAFRRGIDSLLGEKGEQGSGPHSAPSCLLAISSEMGRTRWKGRFGLNSRRGAFRSLASSS